MTLLEAFKFYEVGGKIRDELLGLTSKDVDYVAVPSEELLHKYTSPEQMFEVLTEHLRNKKFEIFLITSDCYTIRAKFPADHRYSGTADFVMARKELGYIPGTRTPIVIPGTLRDDLERRDFTVNALAKDPDTGEIIDLFNGIEDLKYRILRTPLAPWITMNDDPLRILRAIRFAITKRFTICGALSDAILEYEYSEGMSVVSESRIREELNKCFKFDTLKTLEYLSYYSDLRDYIFKSTNLWLKPTNEK